MGLISNQFLKSAESPFWLKSRFRVPIPQFYEGCKSTILRKVTCSCDYSLRLNFGTTIYHLEYLVKRNMVYYKIRWQLHITFVQF